MLEEVALVEESFMPELPEVEVVRRGLEKAVLKFEPSTPNHILHWVFHRKDLRDPIPRAMLETLQGAVVRRIARRAKYLIFETDRGMIVSHLGMTGSWKIYSSEAEVKREKHTHVELHLSKGVLVFSDPRRFGVLDFINAKDLHTHVRFSHLGPEPLEGDFSAEYLFSKLHKKKSSIKSLLMDQKIVVGVGNIYASEVLFRAGISPLIKGNNISKSQALRIVEMVRKVLAEAISGGGSSINDYVQADGGKGSFQQQHFVYDRKGQNCYRCRGKIKSSVIGGRSTFWCPTCQSSKKKIDRSRN